MQISVPGRVNLIGEHIDYHLLPVLPMAIQKRVSISFKPRTDGLVRAASAGHPSREFALEDAAPFPAGDWGNYLKAAVQLVIRRWPLKTGITADITSDLPPAAGLSSSSALMTGLALALLRANQIEPTIAEMMEVLPEGEQYVGTRGGGMDHAAVLAASPGAALLVRFDPFEYEPVPIPPNWAFLVAHSLTTAEKSGEVKTQYNSRRVAGSQALETLAFGSYAQAFTNAEVPLAALPQSERDAFLHVTSEARRVHSAVNALRNNDIHQFGELLFASHASLRDRLRVSNLALDELVECARASGALGARLTGAGFGGCVIILCTVEDRDRVRGGLTASFFTKRTGFVPSKHLLNAEPSAGALYV